MLSFGWDSNGFGVTRGFELTEMLIVCHGAGHNDTICTVERKTESRQHGLFPLLAQAREIERQNLIPKKDLL